MSKSYFSLIELMVVVAVLTVLASLLSPSLNKALEQSRVIACQGNLKPIFLSENHFSNDYANAIFYWGYGEDDVQDRLYWNNPRSRFSSYISYENLECQADPYVSDDLESRYYRDGVSYGRNIYLHARKTNWQDVVSPDIKIFYADSGHRFSDPIERSNARRRNLSSSLHIQPRSSWDVEGIFKRHQDRNANVLFLDGHVEMALDVYLNVPESYNYNLNRSVQNRHWNPTEI